MVQPAILLGTRFIHYHNRGSHSQKSHNQGSHSRESHSGGSHIRGSYSRESHIRGSHSRESLIQGSHSQESHSQKSHSPSTLGNIWRQALVLSFTLFYRIRSIWAARSMWLACHRKTNINTRNWVWLAVYVYIHSYILGISNRCTVSKYGKYCLYFDGTRAYMVVAHSFVAFGGSYAPDRINHQ